MSMTKGVAYSVIGAAAGALVWGGLIYAFDGGLWILAPTVGGAAGFGMMRGTQMKGGVPAGIAAGLVTLVAIFAVRYATVSAMVQSEFAMDEGDAISALAMEVAGKWEEEERTVYDDEGDFVPAVEAEAQSRWEAMSEGERHEYVAAMEEENGESAAAMTPIALAFDFGIMGTVCAALAVGTAFKTGRMTLEEALVEKGLAQDGEEARSVAGRMREEDGRGAGSFSPLAGMPRGGGEVRRATEQDGESRDAA